MGASFSGPNTVSHIIYKCVVIYVCILKAHSWLWDISNWSSYPLVISQLRSVQHNTLWAAKGRSSSRVVSWRSPIDWKPATYGHHVHIAERSTIAAPNEQHSHRTWKDEYGATTILRDLFESNNYE